jgi:glycosyltransferase involved in cell wall biosynthesis
MNEEKSKILISFIIPAHNEETLIGAVLQAIHANRPNDPYEIIVVNNGSTDRTAAISKANNAVVMNQQQTTIALARNNGTKASKGKILIFIDGDVIITPQWKAEINSVIERVLKDPSVVTGSRYGVEDENNWICRYWFMRMLEEEATYINSGHLIVSRTFFDSIHGFDETLETAEDYDFSMRARRNGAKIVNEPKLYVIHKGYPTTLKGFIARERWHGGEDFKSLHKVLHSKEALVSIANVLLFLVCLFQSIKKKNIIYLALYQFALLTLSMLATIRKFGFANPRSLLNTSTIFFFYFQGRTLSLFDKLSSKVRETKRLFFDRISARYRKLAK